MGKPGAASDPNHDTPVFKYFLTCAAATLAEGTTYPLDLTKTRLQIQGEQHVHSSASNSIILKKRGMLKTGIKIAQHEGVLKLWQGILPAVARHYGNHGMTCTLIPLCPIHGDITQVVIVYTGVRIGLYEHLRDNIFKQPEDGSFSMTRAMLSGALGGAIAQFLASPTDLVKVQMQMEGLRKVQGLPPRVEGMAHAFRKLYAERGLLGLWRGWSPNCQRAALVNMADIATYDRIKHLILAQTSLSDNYVTHSLSSVCAGLAAAVVSTPADVVKTRIMNQPFDAQGRGQVYKSTIDCLSKTVKAEGFLALYKGFVPIWARMAPWSLTFWVSYEEIRKVTGASSF